MERFYRILCWHGRGDIRSAGWEARAENDEPILGQDLALLFCRDWRSPFLRPPILMLADGSRAIEHLPPRVARRRPLPTTLLRRHDDEFHGDVHGTMGP